jgi:hypothetical protein
VGTRVSCPEPVHEIVLAEKRAPRVRLGGRSPHDTIARTVRRERPGNDRPQFPLPPRHPRRSKCNRETFTRLDHQHFTFSHAVLPRRTVGPTVERLLPKPSLSNPPRLSSRLPRPILLPLGVL